MTTIHSFSGGLRCITKGAPEILLSRCTKILTKEGEKPLSSLQKKHLGDILQMYAGDALRVLAIGYRDLPKTAPSSVHKNCDNNLIFGRLCRLYGSSAKRGAFRRRKVPASRYPASYDHRGPQIDRLFHRPVSWHLQKRQRSYDRA